MSGVGGDKRARRGGVWLAVALGILFAVIGFLGGELVLGAGRGLAVALVGALVGVLLAYALWSTRPRREETPDPAVEGGDDVPVPGGARSTTRRGQARRQRGR
ncbi:MAG: hypothetical protein M3Q65_24800 [Chloroflexota bacterium]|nr:hypothetical protein [Chloroflexota bacterium]